MTKKFKILVTSDVHGIVYPTKYSDGKKEDMGLAKISSLFKEYKDENTICIDNGDLTQGSPLSFYNNIFHTDEVSPITKVVNYMNYDYINLGNHDFNFGVEKLNRHLKNVGAKCLTANVKINGEPLSKDYHIHTFTNGIKIALFGIVTDYLVNWEQPENLIGVEIFDTFETAKKSIEEIRKNENVDAVIGVYHGGFERDLVTGVETEKQTRENVGYQICKELDFDILITGHQHRSLKNTCCSKIITQTNQQGREVGIIEFDIETKTGNSDVLVPVQKPDENILEMTREIENNLQLWLDKPLGILEDSLIIEDGFEARLNKHKLVSFINQVQLDKSKADFAAVALFNDAVGFNKNITMRDIVSTYVYSNTLTVLKIKGSVFKEFLEKSAEYFDIENNEIVVSKSYVYPKPQHYNYDMVDGLDYTIDVSKPIGSRIVEMKKNEKKLDLEKFYTLCVSNYRASGGGDFLMLNDCEIVKDIQEDMIDVLAEYISSRKNISVNHCDNINIIKG